jgi:hypothetical protein
MNSRFAYKELSLLIGVIVAMIILFTVWISRSSFMQPSNESNLFSSISFPAVLKAFDNKKATSQINKNINSTDKRSSVALFQWLY